MTERVLTLDEVEDAYNAASMYAVKEWHGYQDGNWNVKADFAAALCKLAIQALRSETATKEWDRVERRRDNWTLILNEYRPKFDFKYKDHQGHRYSFFGLVHAEDDLYYGLTSVDGKGKPLVLATCVGALESMYEQIQNGGRCGLCNDIFPITGPEPCERYRCPQGPNPLPTEFERGGEVK